VCIEHNTTHAKEVNNMATKSKNVSPKELAADIGVDPKVLRGYLRDKHPRAVAAKNTSWIITPAIAAAARKHFAKNRAGSAKA
jgi:malate synthase